MKKPLVLAILDGWGIGEKWEHNPIYVAKTPVMDELAKKYPYAVLGASGPPVGLPPFQTGSSEVGHLIIGAGRNVKLPQNIILEAVKTKRMLKNVAYKKAFEHAKKYNSNIHIIGLLSDKGIHSYDISCHTLLEIAKNEGMEDRIFIHVFSDGRDVLPKTVKKYLDRLNEKKEELGISRPIVASVIGRFYAMDRDARWKRTEKAYHAMVYGRADFEATSEYEAVKMAYSRGETDEFIQPTVITGDDGKARARIKEKDAIINFNYRADRAVQLSEALTEEHFEGFHREAGVPKILYVATNEYYENLKAEIAYRRPKVENTLGKILADHNKTQLRITETEKWAHLTFFFNGISEIQYKNEERDLIPSDQVATYDLAPEMQSKQITDQVIDVINEEKYDVIMINFVNPDMVGHTGNKKAVIKAVERVDKDLGRLIDVVRRHKGTVLVTADHGNADLCFDVDAKQPHTAHTMADVPFILVSHDDSHKNKTVKGGGSLQDISPTILDLLKIKKPEEMTGESLIIEK